MIYEECSETFVTYSIILSNTIEITPICVPIHRVSYLNVVRNNIIRETCMKLHHRMHNKMQNPEINLVTYE